MLDASESMMAYLSTVGIRFVPTSEQAAVRTGHMKRRFRDRRGRREGVVADFLIDAHVLPQCSALMTRDAGSCRVHFKV